MPLAPPVPLIAVGTKLEGTPPVIVTMGGSIYPAPPFVTTIPKMSKGARTALAAGGSRNVLPLVIVGLVAGVTAAISRISGNDVGVPIPVPG